MLNSIAESRLLKSPLLHLTRLETPPVGRAVVEIPSPHLGVVGEFVVVRSSIHVLHYQSAEIPLLRSTA